MKESIRNILHPPIKTPIEYWDKYWSYISDKLCDENNHEFVLDSPRFVIDNIISEIEYNNLNNSENSNLFKRQLNVWDSKDYAFNVLFHSKIKLIFPEWGKNISRRILLVCRQVIAEMDRGIYFDKLIEQLINFITNAKSLDYNTKKKINTFTQLIIAEFVAKGFSIDDIKSIQRDIPEIKINEFGKIIVAPDTCFGLNRNNYDKEETYYNEIEVAIKSRTIKEKISNLKNYFYIKPKDCFVLIRLLGLKGDIDFMIGDINIYSPDKKQYIKEKKQKISKIEQINPKRKYINAAIPVQHKMMNSSIFYAKQKLERIIDMLSLSFNTSEQIRYSDKDISIVENGHFIGGIIGFNEDDLIEYQKFVSYISSLDISNIKNNLTTFSSRFNAINRRQTFDSKKLSTAVHWYQKGKAIHNSEDKLLYNWIAIESLLKTNNEISFNITKKKNGNQLYVIQKIISSILVKNLFHNYCFDAYLDLNYKTQKEDNYYDIPDYIIEKASLNMKTGEQVHIKKFFDNIDDIENSVNDEVLKTELHEINLFYKEKNGVESKEKEIKNEILMIYRFRNMIVHNAVYPQYIIDLYANRTQYISGVIIRFLIEKYRTLNISLDDFFVDISLKYDEFKGNIEKEIKKLKNANI